MLKSVWLTKLIINSLSKKDSVLASYYNHISSLVNGNQGILYLLEPDNSISNVIQITDSTAFLLPDIGNDTDNDTDIVTLREIMSKRIPVYEGSRCMVPLFYDNVSAFGILCFDGISQPDSLDDIAEAAIAFSAVLYSEAMGSIAKSFHSTILSAQDLCVDYKTGKSVYRAVDHVDLEINSNEFTIIVGASGCGKTSMLNALGGMMQAAEGRIFYNENDITRFDEKERTAYRRDAIGFIFQRYNLISDLTAYENIEIAASLVNDPLPVMDVLKMVGLESKAKCYPSQMSGGEQQRICIARALVKRSKLLLCDEPTGALDTENATQVIKLLRNLVKTQGIPVVMITHNLSYVVLADHCLTMSNGKIVSEVYQPFPLEAPI